MFTQPHGLTEGDICNVEYHISRKLGDRKIKKEQMTYIGEKEEGYMFQNTDKDDVEISFFDLDNITKVSGGKRKTKKNKRR